MIGIESGKLVLYYLTIIETQKSVSFANIINGKMQGVQRLFSAANSAALFVSMINCFFYIIFNMYIRTAIGFVERRHTNGTNC
jgi:hypothetical protein